MSEWYELMDQLVKCKAFPSKVHRVLLYGPPGTGKSTWAVYKFGRKRVSQVTIHKELPVEDLIGGWQLKANDAGGTQTVWVDGPAAEAFANGKILILDEFDQFGPEIRCKLHEILDDYPNVGLTLPDSRRLSPANGYGVIATTNVHPEVMAKTPLLDRFDLILRADVPNPQILSSLGVGLSKVVESHYRQNYQVDQWSGTLSLRSVIAYHKLQNELGDREKAASLIFGENASDILSMICVQEEE
jgi:hypothetical protein